MNSPTAQKRKADSDEFQCATPSHGSRSEFREYMRCYETKLLIASNETQRLKDDQTRLLATINTAMLMYEMQTKRRLRLQSEVAALKQQNNILLVATRDMANIARC